MGEATRGFLELAHNSLRNQTPAMTERKNDPEPAEKRQAETPDAMVPPDRPTSRTAAGSLSGDGGQNDHRVAPGLTRR